MTASLGILLALACALATNVGFLYKHRGACAAPAVDIRRPLWTAGCLFRTRLFAIGMAIATGAWVFHVVAMAMAPLSIAQAVGRPCADRHRARAARSDAARHARVRFPLLGARDDLVRDRPYRRRDAP